MKYHGACSCGKVKIGIDLDPFLIYNCHCSHCRSFASGVGSKNAKAACHAGAALWRWNMHLWCDDDSLGGSNDVNEIMEYEKTSANGGLFAMSRGRCRHCKDPMVEYCHRLVAPFVMVACDPVVGLPKPNTNIFYNSGYQKGTDGLRTIYSDFGSLLYEAWIIFIIAIPSLPRSIWTRLGRSGKTRSSLSKVE
jgi:hypothetical protein